MALRLGRFAFVVLAASLAGAAHAQPHGGDILLWVEGGRIRTGSTAGGMAPISVFESELGEFAANFTDEPGFDSEPGTFPLGSVISFTVRKALRRLEPVTFNTDIAGGRMDITNAAFSTLTPPTDTPLPGFALAVNGLGQWHHHLGFELLPPASDGVYALELELVSSSGSVTGSDPFWIVFAQNASEPEHELGVRAVRLQLAGECYADVDDGTLTGTPDRGVDISDLLYYLALFDAGDPMADVDDGTGGGRFDGAVDISDLLYFLVRFDAGC